MDAWYVLDGFLSITEENNHPIPSLSQITDIINKNSNEYILLIDVRMPP